MMDGESQLRLQAYLDGELPKGERPAVEAWLARDPEAAALLSELRHTRAAFASFEGELKLPESREFFWSKVERGIRQAPQPARAPDRPAWLAAWRRLLVPTSAVAALTLVLVVSSRVASPQALCPIELEMTLKNGSATTYQDQTHRMTLVWFSYSPDEKPTETDLDEFLLY